MNTFDILILICERKEKFVVEGFDAHDALEKATEAIAEEYHICSTSMIRLVAL